MSEQAAPQPLFYKNPEPLLADRHGKLGLVSEPDYRFAAQAVAIPLNATEVAIIRDYPIVFGNTAPWLPLAVLGMRRDENMFVAQDGAWLKGTYIPSYVRRYPFALSHRADVGQYTLCIDAGSSLLAKKGAQPLFDGKEVSEITRNAMQFCIAFQQEMDTTVRMMAAIQKLDLLVPNQATVTQPSGSKFSLTDFFVVDEKKFAALPDADFLELRKTGALPLIYGHFASRIVWPELVRMLDGGATG